ncbi:MAG TPA: hypothetical protein VIN71_08145, partial [Pseudomonadales bacterium]
LLVSSFMDRLPEGLAEFADELTFEIVSDDRAAVKHTLPVILANSQPDYCVFTGQAPGYNSIKLENLATNYQFTGPPPEPGADPPGEPVEPDGPVAYRASLPAMSEMITSMRQAGIPAAMSCYGGNSRCNQILYQGLHYAVTNGLAMQCGFMHIPALPQQVIERWPKHPFMPLDMSRTALQIIIESLHQQTK